MAILGHKRPNKQGIRLVLPCLIARKIGQTWDTDNKVCTIVLHSLLTELLVATRNPTGQPSCL